MGWVETYDEEVVDSLVVEEEKSRESHETESERRYVAVLVCFPLKRLC